MSRRFAFYFTLMLTLASYTTLGCNNAADTPEATTENGAEHDHEHDHDQEGHEHDHEHHAHGPHGGHVLPLGDTNYQAEWIHENDENRVIVYLLNQEGEPVADAYGVAFETTVAETNTYQLEPQNADNDGKASHFEIVDGELLTALHVAESDSEAATAELIVNLVNGEVRAKIEPHDHDH